MSLSAKLRRAPLRAATGAYILNDGVTKLSADDDTAKSLHETASGTYPFLGKLEPKVFAKSLAAGEMAVGTALLLPVVPPVVAGAALVGFSGALLNMYWRTPGMHHEGSLRPTERGEAISKDVWMFGIGAALIADATLEGARGGVAEVEASMARRRKAISKRARRKARRARMSDAEYIKQLRKHAEEASEAAAKRLGEMRDEYGPLAAEKARTAGDAARHAYEESRHAYEQYRPVAAKRAHAARDAARHAYREYGPVAAEKAQAAREAARHAYEESRHAYKQYRPIARKKMKSAGHAAQEYAARARERVSRTTS